MIVLALLFVVAIVVDAVAVTDSGSLRRERAAPVTAPEHRNRGPPAW
jgi:hypothetical protein